MKIISGIDFADSYMVKLEVDYEDDVNENSTSEKLDAGQIVIKQEVDDTLTGKKKK